MKEFWNEIALNGLNLKWGEKLRLYWFVASLILLGSLAEEDLWIVLILVVNFIVSAVSLPEIKGDDEL
jgi:hypothetical protein